MRNRTVADVMTTDVLKARPTMPLKELARVLVEHHVSALPVLDPDDRLVGVVSEADLLPARTGTGVRGALRRWRRARRSSRGTVARVMSTDPAVIRPEAGLAEAARRMADHAVKRLPVVDDRGRLVGVVSRADLVKVYLRTDDDLRDEIVGEVVVHLLWVDPTDVEVTVVDGIVTLAGMVDDQEIADTAERLVRRVDGVVDVRNVLVPRVIAAHGGRRGHRLHATTRPAADAARDENRGRAT